MEEALLGWSSPGWVRLEEELLRAERNIALLGRLTPLNLNAEQRGVAEALSQGRYSAPVFRYASKPHLSSAADALQAVEISLSPLLGREGSEAQKLLVELLLARTRELNLELSIVRAESQSDLRRLARERYFVSEEDLLAADRLTSAWLEERPAEEEVGGGVVGLAGALAHLMRENSYPFRVLEGDIASLAAVTDDCLVVQRGARGSAELVQRLFVHEVEGHLLPRWHARVCGPPFRIGTAGCSADEEGRALLLEKRASTLDFTRRRILAVRHRVARTVRAEGDLAACCADLLSVGIEAETLAAALCRILRGGGLARELVYLPSYLRVTDALRRYPEDERWLKQGRISVESARKLSVLRLKFDEDGRVI